MRINSRNAAAACLAAVIASGASAQPKGWVKGVEKEHYPGHYSTYWGEIQDWQLWSIESGHGRNCSAIKTSAAAKAPVPIWRGAFESDAPYVWLYQISNRVVSLLSIQEDPSISEYRQVGDKFFKSYNASDADWAEHDGHVVEFHLSGFNSSDRTTPSPKTTFKIDMSGATGAKTWVAECPSEMGNVQP